MIIVLMLAAVGGNVFAQQSSNGIGLRIGEPMGITYKKYLPGHRAWEFGLGTASKSWGKNYYENSFDHYSDYDDYDYRSHNVKSVLYLQGRYLLHYPIPIEGLIGKLDWYWGIGAVLKSASIEYRFQEEVAPFDDQRDTRTDIDFGPEGIAGMEYTFEDVPITIFGEISLLLEFVNRPVALRAFGGTGVRYNF
jgi:hypothetical protein